MSQLPPEIRNMVWTAAHAVPAIEVRCFFSPPGSTGKYIPGMEGMLNSSSVLQEFMRRRSYDGEYDVTASDTKGGRNAYIKSLTPGEVADLVWRQLFLDHSPLSEPVRTILTTLGLFGFDVSARDLRLYREGFSRLSARERVEKVFELANLSTVLYPVDSLSAKTEAENGSPGPGFRPLLRLDTLFGAWKENAKILRSLGFGVKGKVDDFSPLELRRHLAGEVDALKPVGLALDWPGGCNPADNGLGKLLIEAVLPLCRERGLAFFFGMGKRGDTARALPAEMLAMLWETYPDVRFLVFLLDESQFAEIAAAAAVHRNLLVCGPGGLPAYGDSLRMAIRRRVEIFGTAFHACQSEAESLEEMVGRWAHMRWALGEALTDRYAELWRTGWRFDENEVIKDVEAMLGGNIRRIIGI